MNLSDWVAVALVPLVIAIAAGIWRVANNTGAMRTALDMVIQEQGRMRQDIAYLLRHTAAQKGRENAN